MDTHDGDKQPNVSLSERIPNEVFLAIKYFLQSIERFEERVNCSLVSLLTRG